MIYLLCNAAVYKMEKFMILKSSKVYTIWVLLLMFSGITVSDAQSAGYPRELKLKNQDFSNGLADWEIVKDQKFLDSSDEFEIINTSNGNILKIYGHPSTKPVWRGVKQSLPIEADQIIGFTVDLRLEHPLFGHGSFLLIAFFDDDGTDLGFVGGEPCSNIDGVWTKLACAAVAPAGATKMVLEIVLHGQGIGYLKNVEASINGTINPKPLADSVELDVSDEVVCDSLWGFGFEDDGWFYNKLNREHGVTELDYKLNNDRIEWLKPKWVRMFFWHKEWCPSSDGKTFTFESDGMQSHYKTLELYQKLEIPVVFAGTRWGQPTLYDDPKAFASSVGAIFDYLINKKGLTCVKYWTLLNEPNLDLSDYGSVTFAQYVKMHRLVKDEFNRRGLDIKIVGSDDGASQSWFDRCVFDQPYYEMIDVMSSHLYMRPAEARLSSRFLGNRMASMSVQATPKPFIVGEYGFHTTNMDSHRSPLMDTFGYAISNTEFCINLLNHGGAGASIWTSHAAYYADTPKLMDFGLWRYKDQDWSIRPVYHSVAMFTRMIHAGDKAYKVESSHPWSVRAGKAGDTVFWVNMSDEDASIKLNGFSASEATVLTEANLSGERECGDKVAVEGDKFTAPAHSFGYIKENK